MYAKELFTYHPLLQTRYEMHRWVQVGKVTEEEASSFPMKTNWIVVA